MTTIASRIEAKPNNALAGGRMSSSEIEEVSSWVIGKLPAKRDGESAS